MYQRYAVTIRVEHEGGVVARVVDLPLARCAVVAVAGGRRVAVEAVDGLVVGRREREVHVLQGLLACDHRERAADAGELRPLRRLAADAEAGGGADGLVEPGRRLDVRDADPEVVDVGAVAEGAVVDGLDAVAVRVEQEGAVVVVAVLRPWPRLAVALVAGARAGAPELVHVSMARSGEAHVQPPRDRARIVGLREGEVVPLDEPLAAVRPLDPERAEHGLAEPFGGRTVGDADRDVVEHATTIPTEKEPEPPRARLGKRSPAEAGLRLSE